MTKLKFSIINKVILTVIFTLTSSVLNSQIKNIERVISGDYNCIKENLIKIIRLKSNSGETINEIFVFSKKNEFFITNNNNSVHYKVNELGNPSNIITNQNSFSINYFDENLAKSITKASLDGYSIQSTFYSDSKNLLTIHNKSLEVLDKISLNVKSHNYIYNVIEPELSYTESIENPMIIREYKNGNKVIRINNNHFQSIDSSYLNKGKYYRKYHFKENNKDSIVNEKDTVFTQVLKNGKITYENSYFKSNIVFEKKYKDGILINKKEYFYKPYFENKTDSISKGITLWEVKTTLKNRITKSEFPLKQYYKFKNRKLVENSKNKLFYMNSCGNGGAFQRNNNHRLPRNSLFSISIVCDQSFLKFIQRYIDVNSENELNYYRYNFQQEKCTFQIGEDLNLKKQISKDFLNIIQQKNYKIEIIKEDNKTYYYNLNDYINLIYPIVDIISVKEE